MKRWSKVLVQNPRFSVSTASAKSALTFCAKQTTNPLPDMKPRVTYLDETDYRDRIDALKLEAAALEKQLGRGSDKRPSLPDDDVIHSSELLEGYCAQLRLAARTGNQTHLPRATAAPAKKVEASTPAPAKSKFNDHAAERSKLEMHLSSGEYALRYYCGKLGKQPMLTRPKDADMATLSAYSEELRKAQHKAAEACYAKGLCKRPTLSDFEPKPASKPASKPAKQHSFTGYAAKCLARKAAK